jgi:hypothetical protein
MEEYACKRLEDIGQIKEIVSNCYVNAIAANFSDFELDEIHVLLKENPESLVKRINLMKEAILDVWYICKGDHRDED